MLLYLGIYVGSVGIFCSSFVKKSIAATILTIVIGVGILVGTTLVYYIGFIIINAYKVSTGNAFDTELGPVFVFLFNPYSPIFDFMVRALSDSSIYEIMKDFSKNPFMLVIYRFWIPISMSINLLISYMFLKLAAGKINGKVVRGRKKNG